MQQLQQEKQRVNFKNVNTDDNFAILEAVLSNKDINSDIGYEICFGGGTIANTGGARTHDGGNRHNG